MPLFGPPNVQKLAAKGDVKGLIKALQYRADPKIRHEAAVALLESRDAQAIEPLYDATSDEDVAVKSAAAIALGRFGDRRAIWPLILTLDEGGESAVKVLGLLRAKEAVDFLISVSIRSHSDQVTLAAAEALGEIGDAEAIPHIVNLCYSHGGSEEAAFCKVLAKFGPLAVEPLMADLRAYAFFGYSGKRYSYVAGLASAFLAIGTPARDGLVAALDQALTFEQLSDVVAMLDRFGGEPDSDNARAAHLVVEGRWDECAALGSPAEGVLMRLLRSGYDPAPLISTLVTIWGSTATERLTRILEDETLSGIHGQAIDALGMLGDQDATPCLASFLRSGDRDLRSKALNALTQVGGLQASQAIEAQLDPAESREVREAAAEALDKMGWSPASDDARARYYLLKGQWERLSEMGEPVVTLIVDRLGRIVAESQDPQKKDEAITSLGEIADALERLGDKKATPCFVRILQDETLSALHEQAIDALGKLGDRDAISCLASFLRSGDRDLRRKALNVLTQIGGSEVGQALEARLDLSESRKVREAAAEALDKMGWDLGSDDAWARFYLAKGQSIRLLGDAVVRPITEHLLRIVAEPENDRQEEAIRLLGLTGDARATEPLIQGLSSGSWPREAACVALGWIRDTRALEPLREVAATDSYFVVTGERMGGWSEYSCVSEGHYPIREAAEKAIRGIKGTGYYGDMPYEAPPAAQPAAATPPAIPPAGLVIATPENLAGLLALAEPPARIWWEKAEMEMCLVPAGEFLMGREGHWVPEANEGPEHRVYLDAYYIGRYPVTYAQYARFVQATGHRVPYFPEGWEKYLWDRRGKTPPPGIPNYPVVMFDWDDMVAYCRWAGLRLPTEAEWEKAARGTDGRVYPWGDAWDKSRCNSREVSRGRETPVEMYSPAGDSPYGAAGMAGNVWERVNDWFQKDYYGESPYENPQGPAGGECRVLRGGSSADDSYGVYAARRIRDFDPEDRSKGGLGFRCAVSPGE